MLSQPTISRNGRPANRRPVASTAQLSGGIMNGNSNTGSSSSAKRVRVVIALNIQRDDHANALCGAAAARVAVAVHDSPAELGGARDRAPVGRPSVARDRGLA